MNTKANDITASLAPHYVSEYQHWDLVLNTGMDYLAGCATKYVARWRQKAGIEDLRKALHYVNKLRENATLVHLQSEDWRRQLSGAWVDEQLALFFSANPMGDEEQQIISELVLWSTPTDLDEAGRLIVQLLERQDLGSELTASAQPVPAEDSNRHAARVSSEGI